MTGLILKEANYKSKDYYAGLDYLLKNYTNNTHIASCYEGISFRNLARYIKFDRTNKIFRLDDYLKIPRRFLLMDNFFKIRGIAVIASLPELYKEIGCEDYIIVVAEDGPKYKKITESLPIKNKPEIITFERNQYEFLKNKYSVREIHYWSVFESKKEYFFEPARFKLMNVSDLLNTKKLSKSVPEEGSPFRLLKFQTKGFPYYNYKFYFEEGSVFIGTCPYGLNINQITYLISSTTDDNASSALKTINNIVVKKGNRLIWRLRKQEIPKFEKIIDKSDFKKIIEEYHLHLKSPLLKHRKRAEESRFGINHKEFPLSDTQLA